MLQETEFINPESLITFAPTTFSAVYNGTTYGQ